MAVKINKLFNNAYNAVDYGEESTNINSLISVSPLVSDIYEESTTTDTTNLIERNIINEELYKFFMESEWHEKYNENNKKIDKCDISKIYYYFKEKLLHTGYYNLVEILCAIAEFFDFNYKILYNDVLSIKDKTEILSILENNYGLQKHYIHSKKLF